ncbi:expressed unknown protein [Seminavis robusta]|uniref:DUF7467 domain-containing protein n=1 Tax=Seminavis robusta TaxID=568900 RepID=A0A9N8EMW1_9STRA|nr:expressed unknown protein [Seminavis robusta]|eukprot:Sro1253_g256340.1 n/a (1227) ;mRNA; f:11439-15195
MQPTNRGPETAGPTIVVTDGVATQPTAPDDETESPTTTTLTIIPSASTGGNWPTFATQPTGTPTGVGTDEGTTRPTTEEDDNNAESPTTITLTIVPSSSTGDNWPPTVMQPTDQIATIAPSTSPVSQAPTTDDANAGNVALPPVAPSSTLDPTTTTIPTKQPETAAPVKTIVPTNVGSMMGGPSKSPTVSGDGVKPSNAPSGVPANETPVPSAAPVPSTAPVELFTSEEPSHAPTELPSRPVDTLGPTGSCGLQTLIKCQTIHPLSAETVSCDEISPLEDTSCKGPMERAQFQIIYASCDKSRNGQSADAFVCTDVAAFDNEPLVRVVCFDAREQLLIDVSRLQYEDSFYLDLSNSSATANETTCSIYSAADTDDDDEGILLQRVTMDLSSSSSSSPVLGLQNTFGSLQLQGCDDLQCDHEVSYAYTILNNGSEAAIITSLQSNRTSSSGVDVQDHLNDLWSPEIAAGSVVILPRDETINRCRDNHFTTHVQVEATSELSGLTCPSESTYQFSTSVSCLLAVDIQCFSDEGVDCLQLESPAISCGNAPLTELRFKYQPRNCNESFAISPQSEGHSTCVDFQEIPNYYPVGIVCLPYADGVVDSNASFPEETVFPGKTIDIRATDGSALPPTLLCVIRDSAALGGSSLYQEVTFSTSNAETGELLELKSTFGSLQLQRCSDPSGEVADCMAEIDFTYTIDNIGTNEIDITQFERTTNGISVELENGLWQTNLAPADNLRLAERRTVNLCDAREYQTSVMVAANPPNNLTCFGEAQHEFEVNPPCDVVVMLGCTTLGGIDCNELVGEQMVQCMCEDGCPRELVYRYTAASCAEDLEGCADFAPNEALVELVVTSDEVKFFEGRVQIDDDIVLENQGECLPEKFQINVVSIGAGDISQIAMLDSSCDTGRNALLDDFGAFEFVGYTCSDLVPHNCHVDVEYQIDTAWSGTEDQVLSDWNFVLNGVESPGSITFPALTTQNEYSTIIPSQVDLCADGQHDASVYAVGKADTTGEECSDEAALVFNIAAGTPFPTNSPSDVSAQPVSPRPTSVTSNGTISQPALIPSQSPGQTQAELPSTTTQPSYEPTVEANMVPNSSSPVIPVLVPTDTPSVMPAGIPSNAATELPTMPLSNQPTNVNTGSVVGPTTLSDTKPSNQPTIIDIGGVVGPTAISDTVPSNQPTIVDIGTVVGPTTINDTELSNQPTIINTGSAVGPTTISDTEPSNQPTIH